MLLLVKGLIVKKPTPPIRKINEDPGFSKIFKIFANLLEGLSNVYPLVFATIVYLQGKPSAVVTYFLILQVILYLRQIKDKMK